MFAAACSDKGVQSFGPLKVGERAPFGPGDLAAHPYKRVPVSKFYVLVVAKNIPTTCVFEECGIDGDLVRGLGGWITGDQQAETSSMAGLTDSKVRKGEQSIIVVADHAARIVGIYPDRDMRHLRTILDLHPALVQNR